MACAEFRRSAISPFVFDATRGIKVTIKRYHSYGVKQYNFKWFYRYLKSCIQVIRSHSSLKMDLKPKQCYSLLKI
jgi:hypothetical protein